MIRGETDAPGDLYCPACERSFPDGTRCPNDNTRLVLLAKPSEAQIGRELDGRYKIVEKLGQGGMGTVYRGTQLSVGREVAIKVVTPNLVTDPVVIKRFLREATIASKLSHPNAVSVLDFGQTSDGLFYLVMELVEGRTLDRLIETEGRLSAARVVRIGAQIADALEGAHQLEIVHRDLKPSNVMVATAGHDLVKVLDFGLAKSLAKTIGSQTMTNVGALLGSPAFMPPELVTGQHSDARADLYSLGCMLYFAAAGELPFHANTIHELISMHASDPPRPLTSVPSALAQVIERLLAKDPAARFQTAAHTRDALHASLGHTPGDAVLQATRAASPARDAQDAKSATVLGWDHRPMANTGPVRHRQPTPAAPSALPGLPRGRPPTPAPSEPRGVPQDPRIVVATEYDIHKIAARVGGRLSSEVASVYRDTPGPRRASKTPDLASPNVPQVRRMTSAVIAVVVILLAIMGVAVAYALI